LSTLKEIKGNLKQAGFKKEDIGVTLRLFLCLESLDKLVFTESPVTVNFVSGKNPFEYFTGYHQRRNGEEIYNIYVNGIAALIREENKQGFLYLPSGPKNQFKPARYTQEEFLVCTAAHEVRHRFQNNFLVKKFSPRSANLVKDDLLKSVIRFEELVFEECREIYAKEKRSKVYIKGRINQKEFDAKIIERLVAIKIHGKNAYSLREEITSIIKMSAP